MMVSAFASQPLLVAAGLLAAGFLLILRRPASLMRTATKAGSVALLALHAFASGSPSLLVLALALSVIGDAFLAYDGEAAFMGGLAAFLLAHIAYIFLFLEAAPDGASGNALALGFIMGFTGAYGGFLALRAGALAVPVILYVTAIGAMVYHAVPFGGIVLTAALLFMASDALIGLEKFVLASSSRFLAYTAPAIWITYFAAQLLFTLAPWG